MDFDLGSFDRDQPDMDVYVGGVYIGGETSETNYTKC